MMTASTSLQLYSFDGDLILTERKVALSKLSINKKYALDANFISPPRVQSPKSNDQLSITPDNNRTLMDLQIKGADVKREIKTFVKNRNDLRLRPEFNPPRQLDSELLLIKCMKSPQKNPPQEYGWMGRLNILPLTAPEGDVEEIRKFIPRGFSGRNKVRIYIYIYIYVFYIYICVYIHVYMY
jgi:hypothetical protein